MLEKWVCPRDTQRTDEKLADGTPIMLSFSRKVGDIMKHIPEGGSIQPKYKFYM